MNIATSYGMTLRFFFVLVFLILTIHESFAADVRPFPSRMAQQVDTCNLILSNLTGNYLLGRPGGQWPLGNFMQEKDLTHYPVRLQLIVHSQGAVIYQIMGLTPYLDPQKPRTIDGGMNVSYRLTGGRGNTHFGDHNLIVMRLVPELQKVLVQIEDSQSPSPILLNENPSLSEIIQYGLKNPVYTVESFQQDGSWINQLNMQHFSNVENGRVKAFQRLQTETPWFQLELLDYKGEKPEPLLEPRSILPEMREVNWTRVAGNLSLYLLTARDLNIINDFEIRFSSNFSEEQMHIVTGIRPKELWSDNIDDGSKALRGIFSLSLRQVLELVKKENSFISLVSFPSLPPLGSIKLY